MGSEPGRREVDSRLLRTFVVVAQEESFTRAAARLQVSQQAISGHIKSLESILGTSLFSRHSTGARLTAAGSRVIAYAEQALAATDALFEAAAGVDRPIRLAEIRNRKIMQEIWREHRRRSPGDSVSFTDLTGDEQINALTSGRIDVAMHSATRVEAAFTQALLRLDPVKCFHIHDLGAPLLRGQRIGYTGVESRFSSWQRFCLRMAPDVGAKLELVPHDITMLEAIGQQMIQGDVPPVLVLEGMEQYAEADHFNFHYFADIQPYYPWAISIRRDERRPDVLAFFETALAVRTQKGWLRPIRPEVPQWLPSELVEDASLRHEFSGFDMFGA
ncbi:LysR family transcriptional regulator [Rhodococcus sp. HM1]|uniref:LysR family transcriptional regulator n=1 Tax=Rhodococcus sp. HM1 TaxID=2937759 RepID=UPI0024A6434D|nr:LysR family transcriptional regulator [Rhodococcus sp. HM1]